MTDHLSQCEFDIYLLSSKFHLIVQLHKHFPAMEVWQLFHPHTVQIFTTFRLQNNCKYWRNIRTSNKVFRSLSFDNGHLSTTTSANLFVFAERSSEQLQVTLIFNEKSSSTMWPTSGCTGKWTKKIFKFHPHKIQILKKHLFGADFSILDDLDIYDI